MHARSVMSVAAACAFAAVIASASASAAEFSVSGPIVHDNLSVYLVHGAGSAAPVPLTLEQATASGAVKIYESDTHPIAIQNFSTQSVFVPLGALLKGGLQDQVVGLGTLLPPSSGRLPLEVFCVDPFRSTPRGGEDPASFSATGMLLPWHMARLSMLSGPRDAHATLGLRQLGVWWSMDSMRTALAQKLGGPVEPPAGATGSFLVDQRIGSTVLQARQSKSTASLPLLLQSERLGDAQQAYVDAMGSAPEGDVIGAVFAVDGVIKGAEVYGSNALLRAMWPSLLRAYAVEAIAADAAGQAPPSIETVSAFLAGSDPAAAVVSETRAPDGNWVARSFVPTLDPAAPPVTPESAVVKMLATGEVGPRPLASLSRDDAYLVLRPDETGAYWTIAANPPAPLGGWYATIPPLTGEGAFGNVSLRNDTPGFGGVWGMILVVLAFYGLLFGLLGRGKRQQQAALTPYNAAAFARPQSPVVRPAVVALTSARPRRPTPAIARSIDQVRVRTGRLLLVLAKTIYGAAAGAVVATARSAVRLARGATTGLALASIDLGAMVLSWVPLRRRQLSAARWQMRTA